MTIDTETRAFKRGDRVRVAARPFYATGGTGEGQTRHYFDDDISLGRIEIGAEGVIATDRPDSSGDIGVLFDETDDWKYTNVKVLEHIVEDEVPFPPGSHFELRVPGDDRHARRWNGRRGVVLSISHYGGQDRHVKLTDGPRPDGHGDSPFNWPVTDFVAIDTPVETSEGAAPVRDFEVGDKVLVLDDPAWYSTPGGKSRHLPLGNDIAGKVGVVREVDGGDHANIVVYIEGERGRGTFALSRDSATLLPEVETVTGAPVREFQPGDKVLVLESVFYSRDGDRRPHGSINAGDIVTVKQAEDAFDRGNLVVDDIYLMARDAVALLPEEVPAPETAGETRSIADLSVALSTTEEARESAIRELNATRLDLERVHAQRDAAIRELDQFKTRVRDAVIEEANAQGWCSRTDEWLEELGLEPRASLPDATSSTIRLTDGTVAVQSGDGTSNPWYGVAGPRTGDWISSGRARSDFEEIVLDLS